ncbi:MAG: acyl-CoA dehydrogenase family protein [Anaerolineales bacterium]|nr:acyl-CoA dehydrogenase family protein [Anaerolineales bacterium]
MSDFATLRQSVRNFVEEQVKPVIGAYETREETPWALVDQMRALGLFGMLIPPEWGGLGLSLREYATLMGEIERGCGSFRSMLSIQNSLVGLTLLAHGSEDQKRRYLVPAAKGEILVSFGLSEPDAGSNPAEMTTSAARVDGGWRLNGRKMWIGNAARAGVMLIFARSGAGSERRGPEITAFLVEPGPGVRTEVMTGKMGLRAALPSHIDLEDVFVPDASVLGPVGGGLRIALYSLDHGRLSAAVAGCAVCDVALELSLVYAQSRRQFGKPVAQHQLVQELLTDIHVDAQAVRGLLERAIVLKESGQPFSEAAATAKLFASEAANRCAYRAVQVHGGRGYLEETGLPRLVRDARVLTIYEGTSQIMKLVLGRHLTGLSAF